MIEFENYIKELQSEPIENITELSKRSALEVLLKSILSQTNDKIKILHEPRRKENYGSPDFLIYTDSSIIGYVENKKITEKLDKTLKTDQIKKYRELSDNILLTNYIEFIWIKKDVIERETLCEIETLTKFGTLSELKVEKVNTLITKFISQPPLGISSTKELAVSLAIRAKTLKIYLFDELKRQEKEERPGRLFGLFQTFKDNVSSDLDLNEFADAFAQMLVYGLFLAKLNADTKKITLRNAEEFIPQSFQLIRELVSFFDELKKEEYKETRWIVEETISIMNNLQLSVISEQLSFKKTDNCSLITDNCNDPYIYFYEDFLAAYDSRLRKSKGVYYTPPQVVFFIVSAINQILVDDFQMPKGLAQHDKVTALDFATGTGTFLTEIFKQILNTNLAGFENPQGLKKMIIKDHLLKNIYGFEYLIAPYTVTHLKLSQLLKENGYDLSAKERLQVYLTNTLEPAYAKQNLFLPGLTDEGKLAKQIKENPVLVITGNPPYSISSSNTHPMIIELLKDYKKGLNERKINLDDDYIKFIRFAHNKIAKFGQGVVAVITNNSFLDGITHRRMRESLLNDFDKIYIINLHGNSLKKEGDENIFDIRVGVAISIFIKTPKPLKNKEVYYFSTKDNELISRQKKHDFLTNNNIKDIEFEKLTPKKPNFWFVKKDLKNQKQYENGWKLTDIFQNYNSGIQTGKDELVIDFDRETLFKRIKEVFENEDEKAIRQKYKLIDTSGWSLMRFKELKLNKSNITNCNYRPFDIRSIYFETKALKRDRSSIMQHFENKDNIGLVFLRQVVSSNWTHIFVNKFVAESSLVSNKTREWSYIAPLYLYISNGNTDANGNGYLFKEETKRDNFTPEFRGFIKTKYTAKPKISTQEIADLKEQIKIDKNNIEELETIISQQSTDAIKNELQSGIKKLTKQCESKKQKIDGLQNISGSVSFTPSPEQILGYIYAILHSPTYREKYAEFLKFDFPRIPFAENPQGFENLAGLGWELIQAHLQNEIPQGKEYNDLATYKGDGENEVEKIDYNNEKLYINKDQYFDNIPKEVYEFKIGAYQVMYKYLKDRKKRNLSYDEIVNIENIAKVLKYTINHNKLIDNETKKWI